MQSKMEKERERMKCVCFKNFLKPILVLIDEGCLYLNMKRQNDSIKVEAKHTKKKYTENTTCMIPNVLWNADIEKERCELHLQLCFEYISYTTRMLLVLCVFWNKQFFVCFIFEAVSSGQWLVIKFHSHFCDCVIFVCVSRLFMRISCCSSWNCHQNGRHAKRFFVLSLSSNGVNKCEFCACVVRFVYIIITKSHTHNNN